MAEIKRNKEGANKETKNKPKWLISCTLMNHLG